jgi:AmmeMemoRadiSam system protein A
VGFPGVPIQHVSATDRRALLDIARAAIHAHVAGERPLRLDRVQTPPALWRPGASFVTLRRDGQLRGCIGSLEPRRPLAVDVADNAVAAASRDPRFPPLTEDEMSDLEVKISVLTPPELLDVESRTALASVVRPAVDGLLIEAGVHRGTFLPAVWDQLSTVDEFLDHLWAKAGLEPGDWPPGLKVARYRSEEF